MPRPKKTNRSDGRFELKRTIAYNTDGSPVRKSFYGNNKEEALRAYENYRRAEEEKEKAKKSTLFSAWVEQWLEVYKSPDVKPTTFLSTYYRPCKNYIIPYFQEAILQNITPIDLKGFLNTVTHLSQSYIDKIVICLRGIFDAAEDNNLISKNPARHLSASSDKSTTPKRVYDKDSVEYLCSISHKYSLYITILLTMGLRCSELCGLRWSDLDLDKKEMTISQALTREAGITYIDETKSLSSNRVLPIPDMLVALLLEEKNKATNEYVATATGRHITPDHFSEHQLKVFYNSIDVPFDQRLTAHELRHTCGTLLYEETKDIYYVSKFLGHSDIGITTKTYVHSQMHQKKVRIVP